MIAGKEYEGCTGGRHSKKNTSVKIIETPVRKMTFYKQEQGN